MLKAIQFESGQVIRIPLAVSQTINKGDGLVWASGYLAAAAAGEEIVDYVANEAVTTGAAEHTAIDVTPATKSNIRFEATVFANTAAAQRGVAYEMKTASVVDNATAASANGFIVDELVGAAANKVVRGYFL